MAYDTPSQFALVGLIMFLGSVVQGSVGFGAGLLGVPVLILCGFSLPEAATINVVSTSVQNLTGTWKLRSYLEPSDLTLPVVTRFLAIPCGTYVAYLVDQNIEAAQAKQIIGVILLLTLGFLWVVRVPPREHVHLGWKLLAFSSSGLLMGFATMGGVPMILYVNSLTWSTNKTRAFLFFCSASALPVIALAFWMEHGRKILSAATTASLLLPLVFVGLWLGLSMGDRISKPLFRRITYLLILVVALIAIASPLYQSAYP